MAGPLPILVVGGGIGGLAVALALARVGFRVDLFERAAEFSIVGAGIQLGPNAVRVLADLDVAASLAPRASSPTALAVYDGAGGRCLTRMPLGAGMAARCGAPYWTVHRADLHQALLTAAERNPAISIRMNAALTTIDTSARDSIDLTFADGATAAGAALIGADGVWSRAREVVAPDFVPAHSGYCAYRTVLPIERAGDLDAAVVGAWLSPCAHVVHYPVLAGRALNVVVIVREPWSGDQWNTPAEASAVMRAVAPFALGLRDALGLASEWHTWSLPQPVKLDHWHRGRIALVGDAAHAMLPFFAQGAAVALEDATALAAALVASPDDLVSAFEHYHARRFRRVARVQSASVRNGRIFHLSGPLAIARNVVLQLTPAAILATQFDWLYAYGRAETEAL